MKKLTTLLLLTCLNTYAQGEVPAELEKYLNAIQKIAYSEDASFSGFSAFRGEELFFQKNEHDKKPYKRSCSTCHGDNPKQEGRTRAGKPIKPMAPVNENGRFTKTKKIEKWFKRNCKWTLGKLCSTKQKGDFLTYLIEGTKK